MNRANPGGSSGMSGAVIAASVAASASLAGGSVSGAVGAACVVGGATVGGVVRHEFPEYEGDYEVTPRPEAFQLETRDVSMRRKLTIMGIPYSATSNLSGGYTANIGG